MAKIITDRMKDTEVIRVRGDVYDRISVMAQAGERTMGGQVAFMEKKFCGHPRESLVEVTVELAPVEEPKNGKPARVVSGLRLRGFCCELCGQLWLNEPVPDILRMLAVPLAA